METFRETTSCATFIIQEVIDADKYRGIYTTVHFQSSQESFVGNNHSSIMDSSSLYSSSLYATTTILIGLVMIAATYFILKKKTRVWHGILYPTEECARVRGVLVTINKFPAADSLPVQQKSTDEGELVF